MASWRRSTNTANTCIVNILLALLQDTAKKIYPYLSVRLRFLATSIMSEAARKFPEAETN